MRPRFARETRKQLGRVVPRRERADPGDASRDLYESHCKLTLAPTASNQTSIVEPTREISIISDPYSGMLTHAKVSVGVILM